MVKKNFDKKFSVVLIIGVLLIAFSIVLYILNSDYWFYPAPLGVWLVFDFLSFKKGNITTLSLVFDKKYKKVLALYLLLVLFGTIIELVGMILFKLWGYAYMDYSNNLIHIFDVLMARPLIISGYFIYPFILMSFKETYSLITTFFKSKIFSVILAMIVGIIIWEVPNVFSQDWVYTIPYISFEIFHINIVVIVGWVILIEGPLIIANWLDIK